MKPGDPVRVYGGRKVCVGIMDPDPDAFIYRECDLTMLAPERVHAGRAATHRKDGTAYPLCKVCWPDGEVG